PSSRNFSRVRLVPGTAVFVSVSCAASVTSSMSRLAPGSQTEPPHSYSPGSAPAGRSGSDSSIIVPTGNCRSGPVAVPSTGTWRVPARVLPSGSVARQSTATVSTTRSWGLAPLHAFCTWTVPVTTSAVLVTVTATISSPPTVRDSGSRAGSPQVQPGSS